MEGIIMVAVVYGLFYLIANHFNKKLPDKWDEERHKKASVFLDEEEARRLLEKEKKYR